MSATVSWARTEDGAACVRVALPLTGAAPDADVLARLLARGAPPGCPPLADLGIEEDALIADYAIAGVLDLARISRPARISGIAARYLGHALAAQLAEAHAVLDEEGAPAPLAHGRIGAEEVILDARGGVHLVGLGLGEPAGAPRTGTRDDVRALALLLGGLGWPRGGEIEGAIGAAAERGRMTACELAAWLGRGLDLEVGRRALAALVARALARDRPLPPAAQVGVAAITAALIFGLGVLALEVGRPPANLGPGPTRRLPSGSGRIVP